MVPLLVQLVQKLTASDDRVTEKLSIIRVKCHQAMSLFEVFKNINSRQPFHL